MTLALWLSIAASTFVSEDVACLAAGALLQQGALSPLAALSCCAVGIFAGDVGLWALGRIGSRSAVIGAWVATHVTPRLPDTHARLRAGLPLVLVASRFVPGTRVALYVACGLLRVPVRSFALWVGGAVLMWTPLIVFGSAGFLGAWQRHAPGQPGAGLLLVGALTIAVAARSRSARVAMARGLRVSTAHARHVVERCRRWEFWPMWLFYAPLVPWLAWLSLRHGGVMTMTAANPGIAAGGTVGESKADILAQLPQDAILRYRRVHGLTVAARITRAEQARRDLGINFPIVLKPDVGERGRGVRIAYNQDDVDAFCATCDEPFLVQQYHPGPHEAGVFYYRRPGDERGHILSITDKRFPVLIGDGRSTLTRLITEHPRYRMQAPVFLERHAASLDRVLGDGEHFQLAQAGNHSQGTMFLDGEWLRSTVLEARIDEIARAFPGFFIGRFDIRYTDPVAFSAGGDLAVVELNGATAEPTDLYDPKRSLFEAYRLLFRQWTLVFEIGAANRRRGAAVTPAARLLAELRTHWRAPARAAD